MGVVDREGEPIDIGSRLDIARKRNRAAIGRQDIAKLLGCKERVVIAAVDLCGFTDKWRVAWNPAKGKAGGCKANVCIGDRCSGELLVFTQADLQLISTSRESLANRIRIA